MSLGVVLNSWFGVSIISFYPENTQISVVMDQASLPHCLSLSAQVESIICWSRGSSGTCADSQS